MKVVNPATEEVVGELEEDNETSIAEKFKRAEKAQREWAALPLAERKIGIQRLIERFEKKKDLLAQTLTREMGKPLTQSKNEIRRVLPRIQYFLDEVDQVTSTQTVWDREKLQERISFEPLGVVANISAWNFPYFVGTNVFVPALLCGNAVLYKPSEFTSMTGLAIAECLEESGIPRDVFIPVIGTGEVGKALLKQPINGVFFTGSLNTGRAISKSVAVNGGRRGFPKIQLELGGKDPVYVCRDVDVDKAAASLADGAFYNAGQSCCSVERIYVESSIHDRFVEVFVETVKGFVVGDPEVEETYLGPLTRKAQLDVLEDQVEDALKKGAKFHCGGSRREGKGYYFEPTVLTQVDHSMKVMKEESFGPIVGIQGVKGDKEAIEKMNDTEFGLTAGVYSKDQKRAEQILNKVNAGSVYWNGCDRVSPRLPWTGWQNSGIGSTLSRLGIQAFTQPKAWHLIQPKG